MAARSWCFTLFNYDTEALDNICKHESTRYVIWGEEVCPDSGRQHLQGYVEFSGAKRMAGVKKAFGRDDIHLGKRKGTREQARDYCMKDGIYHEHGDWEQGGQGKRNDLRSMMAAIKQNPTDVIGNMEMDPACYSKHQRFLEKYTCVLEREQTKGFRKVETEVIWGDAGTGKTRRAFEADPDLFTVNTDETFPFDGYNGEKTILIDDFYGGLKYHHLLRILDGHQLRVNVKGSSRYARWTKVFITSNVDENQWYKQGCTPALRRRLTRVTRMLCHEVPGNTMPAPLDPETDDSLDI